MNALHEVVRQVASDLNSAGVRWALIGGLAVSARSEPRFTRDADFAVAVTGDPQAEAVVRDLLTRGYRTVFTLEHKKTGRLATVRLKSGGEGVVDLLFASSGIEAETVDQAEILNLTRDLVVPIATLHHLLAMKTLARDDVARPNDIADMRILLSRASPGNLEATRVALRQIMDRGYGRGRDLVAEFDEIATPA